MNESESPSFIADADDQGNDGAKAIYLRSQSASEVSMSISPMSSIRLSLAIVNRLSRQPILDNSVAASMEFETAQSQNVSME